MPASLPDGGRKKDEAGVKHLRRILEQETEGQEKYRATAKTGCRMRGRAANATRRLRSRSRAVTTHPHSACSVPSPAITRVACDRSVVPGKYVGRKGESVVGCRTMLTPIKYGPASEMTSTRRRNALPSSRSTLPRIRRSNFAPGQSQLGPDEGPTFFVTDTR